MLPFLVVSEHEKYCYANGPFTVISLRITAGNDALLLPPMNETHP